MMYVNIFQKYLDQIERVLKEKTRFDLDEVGPKVARIVRRVWADWATKEAFRHRSEFHIVDSVA